MIAIIMILINNMLRFIREMTFMEKYGNKVKYDVLFIQFKYYFDYWEIMHYIDENLWTWS